MLTLQKVGVRTGILSSPSQRSKAFYLSFRRGAGWLPPRYKWRKSTVLSHLWGETRHSHRKFPSVLTLSPVGLGVGDQHGNMTLAVDLVVSINQKKTPLFPEPGVSCFFSIHTYNVHNCASGVTSQTPFSS